MKGDPRTWAEDVLTVYTYLGVELPEEDATPAREALHEWVHAHGLNKKEFLKAMAPKASDILAKLHKPDEDTELVAVEKRSILELKEAIFEAIDESQKDDRSYNQA